MKTTNILYEGLKEEAKYIDKKYNYCTSTFLSISNSKIGKKKLTKEYEDVNLLDEVHIITLNKGKKLIQRLGFTGYPDALTYEGQKEMPVLDITGYEVVGDSSKTLLLKDIDGFYTFLDYNINSRFYMLPLVPCCLEEAHIFDREIKGYAYASYKDSYLNKQEGYLSRDDFMAKEKNQIKLYSKEEIIEKKKEKITKKVF